MRETSKRGDGCETWCSARLSWGRGRREPPANSRRAMEASLLFSPDAPFVSQTRMPMTLSPRICSPFGDSICLYPPAKALHGPHGPPGDTGDATAPTASRMECGLVGPCRGHRLIVSCSRRVSRAYPGGQTQLVSVCPFKHAAHLSFPPSKVVFSSMASSSLQKSPVTSRQQHGREGPAGASFLAGSSSVLLLTFFRLVCAWW